MTAAKVRLAVLRRKTSKNGREYFMGWLPTCNLLLFRSEADDDEYGEAWALLAAERETPTKQRGKQPSRRRDNPQRGKVAGQPDSMSDDPLEDLWSRC